MMQFPTVLSKPILLESEEDYNKAVEWQHYFADLLVKMHKQNTYGIAMRLIPGVKPRAWGIYLEMY